MALALADTHVFVGHFIGESRVGIEEVFTEFTAIAGAKIVSQSLRFSDRILPIKAIFRPFWGRFLTRIDLCEIWGGIAGALEE